MAIPDEVASWMLRMLETSEHGELDQQTAAYGIKDRFGEEFVYVNENGNLAIDRRVLRSFRKLTEDTVVFERYYQVWRKRTATDDPHRRQVD